MNLRCMIYISTVNVQEQIHHNNWKWHITHLIFMHLSLTNNTWAYSITTAYKNIWCSSSLINEIIKLNEVFNNKYHSIFYLVSYVGVAICYCNSVDMFSIFETNSNWTSLGNLCNTNTYNNVISNSELGIIVLLLLLWGSLLKLYLFSSQQYT